MSKKKSSAKARKKRIKNIKTKNLVSLESKTKIEPIKKNKKEVQKKQSKKFIRRKRKHKQKIIKRVIIAGIIVVVLTISAFLGYNYVNDNYLNKVNYTFKTNLQNTKAVLSCSNNKYEDIKENIDNTVLNTNLYYDQITIKNGQIRETITNDKSFFKYYGEQELIIPSEDEYTIDYVYFTPFENQTLEFESDNKNVTINDNVIKVSGNGEATIYAYYGENKVKLLEILFSDLIVSERPKEFDTSKKFLTCEQYTDEENAMLDKILEKKIANAGYLTRAGVVESLRFLTLDLPYRVDYFNENGRLPLIDAEGRYYHKGLYLSSGKYKDLLDPNRKNKGTWGCTIYSNPLQGYEANGLDCSGLMGWALVNAGFDPDDIKGSDLLLDLGEKHNSKEIIDSGRVKVGDFVHNNEATSHIGMLIGIDDEENYYVAQAIWYKPDGVIISKYTKKQFINHWLEIVLLDEYYKEDGNLTNMWY